MRNRTGRDRSLRAAIVSLRLVIPGKQTFACEVVAELLAVRRPQIEVLDRQSPARDRRRARGTCLTVAIPYVDAQKHQRALLLRRLHFDKAHTRPGECLTDRLGVGHIVLLPLHVRLHRPAASATPHRRTLATVAPNDARWCMLRFRPSIVPASRRTVAPALASGVAASHRTFSIYTVHLKYPLPDIQSN